MEDSHGNDVMYAVSYYSGGYLVDMPVGIYKYHTGPYIRWYDETTRSSENGTIYGVSADNKTLTVNSVYATNLTGVAIQYSSGGRFPEYNDVPSTTHSISGTTLTATSSTDLSTYDTGYGYAEVRVKLTYSDGTVVYTDTYQVSSGGLACFTKDTQVETEEGFKAISKIQVGDKVYSYNFDTGEVELKEVDKIVKHEVKEIVNVYTDNEILETTGSHPFYVILQGRKYAKNLQPHDQLRMKNKMITKVNQLIISELKKEKTVYEIRVKDNNNYFVGNSGILVYNETSVL